MFSHRHFIGMIVVTAALFIFLGLVVRADAISDDISTIKSAKAPSFKLKDAVDRLGKARSSAAVEPLLNLLSREVSAGVKLSALAALGDIGDGKAIPGLLKYATDKRSDIEKPAKETLDKFNDPKFAPFFVDALKSPDKNIRRFVVRVLGRLKNDDALVIGVLENAALKDKDVFVRNNALSALSWLAPDKAKNTIVAIAVDPDRNESLRSAAIKAIRRMTPENSIESFAKCLALEGKKNEAIAQSAKREIYNLISKKNIRYFIAATKNPSVRVRTIVLESIAGMDIMGKVDLLDKDREILVSVFLTDDSAPVREAAIRALLLIGGKEAAAMLAGKIGDKLADMSATEALGALKMIKLTDVPAALEKPLVALLERKGSLEEEKIVLQALRLLTDMRSVSALPKMRTLLESQNALVKCAAIFAVGFLGDKPSMPILHKIIKEIPVSQFTVRDRNQIVAYAIRALGAMKDEKLLEMAEGFLARSGPKMMYPPELRVAVVHAMYKLKTKAAMDVIVKALDDPTAYVRKYAIQFLAELDYKPGLTKILDSADVQDDEIVQLVMMAIGRLGSETEMKYLARGLQSNNPAIVVEALNSIERIGKDNLTAQIVYLLKEDSLPVRSKSYEVLKKLTNQKILFFPAGSHSDISRGYKAWQAWWTEKVGKMVSSLKKDTPRKELLAAIDSLARYKISDAAEKIGSLLNDNDKELTLAGLKAIRSIANPLVGDVVLALCWSKDREIRIEALKTLCVRSIAADKHSAKLELLFEEADAIVRNLAIKAVVAAGGADAMAALKKLLAEDKPREDIKMVLKEMMANPVKDMVPLVIPLVKYPKHIAPAKGEKSVRELASVLLTKITNLRGPDPLKDPENAFKEWSQWWKKEQAQKKMQVEPQKKSKQEKLE